MNVFFGVRPSASVNDRPLGSTRVATSWIALTGISARMNRLRTGATILRLVADWSWPWPIKMP